MTYLVSIIVPEPIVTERLNLDQQDPGPNLAPENWIFPLEIIQHC